MRRAHRAPLEQYARTPLFTFLRTRVQRCATTKAVSKGAVAVAVAGGATPCHATQRNATPRNATRRDATQRAKNEHVRVRVVHAHIYSA